MQQKDKEKIILLVLFSSLKGHSLYTFQQAENSIEKSLPPILEGID